MHPIQSRPSSVLWGHLLNGGGSASNSSSNASSVHSLSPITPLDKAGTTMRILLHDTQANLEKFSDRVTTLTGGIDETKREIRTIQKLFQQDHEKLIEDTVDLVNRCQAEVQKSLGDPAQASKVDELRAHLSAVDRKIEALDKKIDVLHMLNQTQSQALQTLQDQQGKILHALVPMLPLLQAVPLHIENARHNIKEAVSDLHPCPRLPGSAALTSRNRTLRTTPSFPSAQDEAAHSKKRRRLDNEVQDHQLQVPNTLPDSSPWVSDVPLNQHQQPPVLPFVAQNTSGCRDAVPPISCDAFQTPRRMPLADLLRKSSVHSSTLSTNKLLRSGPAATSAGILLKTPLRPASSLPRSAISRPSLSRATPSRLSVSPDTKDGRPALALNTTSHHLSGLPVVAPRTPPATSALRSEEPSPLSSILSSPTTNKPPISAHAPQLPPKQIAPLQSSRGSNVPEFTSARRPPLQDALMTATSFSLTPMAASGPSAAVKPMSLKDRRALLAEPVVRNEGKRFIPLDDEDDGESLME